MRRCSSYEAALCALAVALLAALVREPWARSRVTDLVVDLGEARSGTLRDALARALGDPTLEVGYWLGEPATSTRRAVRSSCRQPGSERRVTRVERDGQEVAVLVHDPAVLDDPGLVGRARSGGAAGGLERASAGRGASAARRAARVAPAPACARGDEERRRLERRLRETVERRLIALARTLAGAHATAAAGARMRGAEEQLARTLEELRELAAGLHPGGAGRRRARRRACGRSPRAARCRSS